MATFIRRAAAGSVIALLLSGGSALTSIGISTAEAATVQPAPGGVVDVLLDSEETHAAAVDRSVAETICTRDIAPGAAALGAPSVMDGGYCPDIVKICAARAVAAGSLAGVTLDPDSFFWCFTH